MFLGQLLSVEAGLVDFCFDLVEHAEHLRAVLCVEAAEGVLPVGHKFFLLALEELAPFFELGFDGELEVADPDSEAGEVVLQLGGEQSDFGGLAGREGNDLLELGLDLLDFVLQQFLQLVDRTLFLFKLRLSVSN